MQHGEGLDFSEDAPEVCKLDGFVVSLFLSSRSLAHSLSLSNFRSGQESSLHMYQ